MFSAKSKEIYDVCGVRLPLDILAKSWNAAILLELELVPAGTLELHRSITPKISKRILSNQLNELEQLGVIGRKIVPETNLKIEYELTPRGVEIVYILKQLQLWSDKHNKHLLKNAE